MNYASIVLGGIFLILVSVLAFRSIKYGSVTGSYFKSRITKTLGKIKVLNSGDNLEIQVHELAKSEPGWVGLELSRYNGRYYQVNPILLSQSEAKELAEMLLKASQGA